MRTSLTLRLPREATTVAVARATCRATLGQLGVTDQCAADVSLAVTEACANAVEHALDGGDDYEVRIDVRDVWLRVQVVDHGVGFDTGEVRTELPRTWTERGRGLGLMRHLMDDVVVTSRVGAGTHVLLAKRLDVEAWSPLVPGDRQLESA